MELWDEVETIQDFFYCNMKFISGELPATPYHHGSLAKDSIPLSDDLLKLHEYNVLTVDGQGSLIDKNKKVGHDIVSVEQKPYLSCFLEKKYKEQLIEFFENKIHLMYIIQEYGKQTITNITNKRCNVTRTKKNKDKTWNLCTNLWTDHCFMDSFNETFYEHEFLFDKVFEEYIYVDIASNVYGCDTSIEKTLLSFFRSVVPLPF